MRANLDLFATVCFGSDATARAGIEADIKRALCSYPGGVGPLDQYVLDRKKAVVNLEQTLGSGSFADVHPGK